MLLYEFLDKISPSSDVIIRIRYATSRYNEENSMDAEWGGSLLDLPWYYAIDRLATPAENNGLASVFLDMTMNGEASIITVYLVEAKE